MTHPLLDHAIGGHLLHGAEAEELMEELLGGRLETSDIVQLLGALNERPFRTEELAGFARAVRRPAARVFAKGERLPERMVDTCGTRGGGSGTFHILTAAALFVAAARAPRAKDRD